MNFILKSVNDILKSINLVVHLIKFFVHLGTINIYVLSHQWHFGHKCRDLDRILLIFFSSVIKVKN